MIDSESKEDDSFKLPTKKDAEQIEREGLYDEANLYLFLEWYSFGGYQKGFTLEELVSMPFSVKKDFTYILSQMHRERKRRKSRDPNRTKQPRNKSIR